MPNVTQVKTTLTYHNNKVLHPNGNLMFYTNPKKINFYLKKDLAKIIEQHPDGRVDIQLTFQPKGYGCVSVFDLSEKKNICVVNGESENLTQHHVIPAMFSKFFPLEFKNHNAHDVVLIGRDLHHVYEREADEFKDKLAKEYGCLTLYDYNRENIISEMAKNPLYKNTIGTARALFFHIDNMPLYRIEELEQKFREFTGEEPTKENLKLWSYKDSKYEIEKLYGEYFVPFIPDIKEFCVSWRKHFIETMNPKFLPVGWSVNGNFKID